MRKKNDGGMRVRNLARVSKGGEWPLEAPIAFGLLPCTWDGQRGKCLPICALFVFLSKYLCAFPSNMTPSLSRFRPLVLATTIAALLAGGSAQASLVLFNESNTTGNFTLPTGFNLLSGAAISPATATVHEGSSSSWTTLIDGILGANSANGASVTPNNNESVLFSLDLSTNIFGYSLTSLDSYSLWGDSGRDNQDYTIQYATVSAPTTFLPLTLVENHTGAPLNSTHSRLTDTTGFLGAVSGISSLRFTFVNQENGYTGFREFIALGTASTAGLTWSGNNGTGGNSTWTSGADNNWKNSSTGVAQNYSSADALTFDSTGANTNITVQSAGLNAFNLKFTNDETKAYTLSGGAITTGAVNAFGSGIVTIKSALVGPNVTMTGSGLLDISGAITGAGGVSKSEAGILNLSGANTYTGVTQLAGGILNAATFSDYGVPGSLGARPSDEARNVGILFQGGTLQYTGATAQSTNRAIRISTNGGATIDASGSTPEATLSFTATSSPDFFENAGNRTLTLTGTNTGNNTFGMAITEAGRTSVVKNGPGTWVLSGANTYSGQTVINAGALRITTSGGLGAGGFNGTSNSLIADGGALELQGDITVNEHFHFTGAGPAGAGGLRSVSGNNSLTTDFAIDGDSVIGVDAGTLTVTAKIYTDLFSGPGITKVGAGTLVFAGANSYNGPTSVNGGTLVVNGSLTGSSTLTVNNGGVLILGAISNVNPNATIGFGGGPEATSGGTLRIADNLGANDSAATETFGALALTLDSTLDFGTSTGGVKLLFSSFDPHSAETGANLAITNWTGLNYTLGTDATDRLIFNGDASDFTNAFAQSDVSFNGITGYQAISFGPNAGYEIVAVPEPSSWMLVPTVLGLLRFRQRRRA